MIVERDITDKFVLYEYNNVRVSYRRGKMSLYERIIHEKLKQLHRVTGGGAVRTTLLADHVGKNDRTLRLYLARMEAKGVVQRRGCRGGWIPA